MSERRADDGWIVWNGASDEGPTLTKGATYEYRFRDGDVLRGADHTDVPFWGHVFGNADVVAYREVTA